MGRWWEWIPTQRWPFASGSRSRLRAPGRSRSSLHPHWPWILNVTIALSIFKVDFLLRIPIILRISTTTRCLDRAEIIYLAKYYVLLINWYSPSAQFIRNPSNYPLLPLLTSTTNPFTLNPWTQFVSSKLSLEFKKQNYNWNLSCQFD